MRIDFPDASRSASAAALFLALDAAWFAAATRLGAYSSLQSDDVRLTYALVAWAALALAVGSGRPETAGEAAAFGMGVGALAYGVFNGTEAAVRPDWRRDGVSPVADFAWGVSACTAVSSAVFFLDDAVSRAASTAVSLLFVGFATLAVLARDARLRAAAARAA